MEPRKDRRFLYHLDVTYDDPVGPTKTLSHDYFNLPTT